MKHTDTLTSRQKRILEIIVREYSKNVVPVSSKYIETKYTLDVSPATVRIEMQKLKEKGYLYQEHSSGGRIPTDKAYRFFVDEIIAREEKIKSEKKHTEKGVEKMLQDTRDPFDFIQEFSKELSDATNSFVGMYWTQRQLLWKEGWENLFQEPEFHREDALDEFFGLLENVEKHVSRMHLDPKVYVFIGDEKGAFRNRYFATVIARCKLPKKQEGIITLVGVKRMKYPKALELLDALMKPVE